MSTNAAARELGYIKFICSTEAEEILSDPAAFALLALIARRAWWHDDRAMSGTQTLPGTGVVGALTCPVTGNTSKDRL